VNELIDLALGTLKARGCAGYVGASTRDEWSADVRLGQIETVESAATRGLRVTALGAGNRTASCTTADIAPAAVRAVAERAAELVAYADEDPYGGLPPEAERGVAAIDLKTDDAAFAGLDRAALAKAAIAAEATAMAHDPRVSNSHRSGASATRTRHWYGTSDGTRVETAGTRFGYHVVVVAQDAAGERQTGAWGTMARSLAALKPPASVGGEAGRRAVQGFGWKTVPSGRARVLLHRDVASQLLGIIGGAISGGAVYRGSSFLAGALGTAVASDVVTIVDDPLLPGELGSRRCDGEGVRSRRLEVIGRGHLASFLVDGYAARRLKHPYTGHDGGASNLRLTPGSASWDDLVRELGTGLIVTQFHGFGVDLAAGTISKGASGFWVADGRVQHPVQEVTVAGDLRELLQGIRAVGDDPLTESPTASPSLLIDGFTIGGK